MSRPVHATCFDASALVKRYVDDEPGTEALRRYWNCQATRYTTPFCFYETLGVLKRLKSRGALSKDAYLKATDDLHAWYRHLVRTEDIDFTDRDVYRDARELVVETDLDLSDAFQLLTLQAGFFSGLVGGSSTLLVTADEELAKAARQRKLPVWDCLREPVPHI